jgi:hypothetical protein
MLVLTYIISLIVFSIAAWILPLPFLWIVGLTKPKDEIITPTDIRFVAQYVGSTVILLYLTKAIWAKWGYDPGWLFPSIIGVLHFLWGGSKGENFASQAQAYGVVFGVIVYGITRIFW